MAGDWIKVRKSLPADPRVVRISSALDADRFRTVGGLIAAWCLFDEQTEDGRLDGYSTKAFDEIVGISGLAEAMALVGWLEIGDGFLAIPRFDEHNGQSAKRRAKEAVRKASARNADNCPHEKRTKCGSEKRREEKIRKTNKRRASLEEIVEFATSEGMHESDGECCFLKWSGNGWTNGGSPIKDWRATFRNWKIQGFLPSQKGGKIKPSMMHPPNELEVRVGMLAGRSESDYWTTDESALLASLGEIREDDILLLEGYYNDDSIPMEIDHRCKSLASILANWNREKDKARVWGVERKSSKQGDHRKW